MSPANGGVREIPIQDRHPTCYLALLRLGQQDIGIKTWRRSGLWLVCLSMVVMGRCAQQPASVWPNDSATSGRALPFDRTPDTTGNPATADLAHPTIPAGTVMVIRLQFPISSATAHTGENFQAVLDEPVLLASRAVLPSGTVVYGRILAAKPGDPQEAGYLRLTLSWIGVDNRTVKIHTSSLFVKGSLPGIAKIAAPNRSQPIVEDVASHPQPDDEILAQSDVKFSTARRLTFRLLQPLPLSN